MSFDSHFWSPSEINKEYYPQERSAFFQVRLKSKPAPTRQKYFLVLLQSDNPIAKGYALDLFYFHESQAKKLEDNPFRNCIEEVLSEARVQLQQPPVVSNASIIDDIVGANHASAFLILSLFGTASDLDLIAPILHSSSDLNVIYTGCLAAIHCLETTINVYPQQVFPEIVSALRKHLFNELDLTIHILTDTKSERRAKLALVEEVRKQIEDRFRCYYWNPLDIIDPLLGQAYILLVYSSKTEVLLSCYYQLLTSDEPAAIGIALDRYSHTQKQTRFGGDNLYLLYRTETQQLAREQLQQPPIVCIAWNGQTVVGANYASALSAMMFLGEEQDIATIRNIVSNSSDIAVVSTGCCALSFIYHRLELAYDEELLETFSTIIFNSSLSITARSSVFDPLGGGFSSQSNPIFEEWLLSIIQSPLPSQILNKAASIVTNYFPQYTELVTQLSQTWEETEVSEATTQPTLPPTDIPSLIITKKEAELNEVETQISQLDTQISRLNGRISNLSAGRFNPITHDRSSELKQQKKELIAQKEELSRKKANLEEKISFYQRSET